MTGALPTAASLYERVRRVIPPVEWSALAVERMLSI